MTPLDVVVGRQPIFTRNLSVMGYELLFRRIGGRVGHDRLGDVGAAYGDALTAEVLFSSMSIGIDSLVSNKKIFCNASRGVLTCEVPVVLPVERTVIEVLETVTIDDEVLEGCRRLSADGFDIALDDFTWIDRADLLLDIATFVKIDVLAIKGKARTDLIARCRNHDVSLIAEKVETIDEFRRCEDEGFDYFQGRLLARARAIPGRALRPERAVKLRLSARLLDSECPMAELEDIVRTDPAMVHQLLRLAEIGAAGGMRRSVKSLREALVLVGWRRLQAWVSLLLIADRDGSREEEIVQTLTKARMCELVAADIDRSMSGPAFAAGMLSNLGILLDAPLSEVLGSLPLHEELRKAALGYGSRLGQLVADVTDFLTDRRERATRINLPDRVWSTAALSALTWAVEMTSAIHSERSVGGADIAKETVQVGDRGPGTD